VAARTPSGLLADIQAGALDPRKDLADVLRQCVALGGETGSVGLREWATKELKGYPPDDEVPSYRLTGSLLFLDGVTGNIRVTGQQVPYNMIPDVARERLKEDIPMRQPIAELVDIVESHRRRGESSVKLTPPLAQELVALMNHDVAKTEEGGWPGSPASKVVERVYWMVGLNVFTGIIDTVRTTLVELVAEMRAGTPAGAGVPTREVADQALEIAVNGKVGRLIINQVGPGSTAVATAGGTASAGNSMPESRSRRWMWWLVGIAGVLTAAAAIAALFVH
jgi:hypothetical protein